MSCRFESYHRYQLELQKARHRRAFCWQLLITEFYSGWDVRHRIVDKLLSQLREFVSLYVVEGRNHRFRTVTRLRALGSLRDESPVVVDLAMLTDDPVSSPA